MEGPPSEPNSFINSNTIDDSEVTMPTKRKRKEYALRSPAWNHFDKIKGIVNGVEMIVEAKCQHCKKVLKANTSDHGTSSLKNHLRICKENPANFERKDQSELSMQPVGDGKGVLSNWKFDQMVARNAFTEMIVIDEIPLRFVEREGFRRFIAAICPRFQIPSRTTLARDIYGLYDIKRGQLQKLISSSCQRACLTTDTWTSCQRINYMCLTIHYIDPDWKLQKRIINFTPISSHKGEAISGAIEKCLRGWGLDRVFTITVDNASSNDTAMLSFRRKMSKWDSTVLKGEYVHMRCVAHILNLIVVEGLKDISKSVRKVREAVRYVRQSPARLQKFNECAKMENIECKSSLCLDVCIRWSSSFTMMNVAEKKEVVFERFDEEDPNFKIDLQYKELVDKIDEDGNVVYGIDGKPEKVMQRMDGRPGSLDWLKVRQYASLLEHFYKLTLKVSGTSYVTSNCFFHEIAKVYLLLKKWQSSSDVGIKEMSDRMKKKFDKYWGDPEKMNKMLFIAVVLDPRYKAVFLDFLLKEVYGAELGSSIMVRVKDLLNVMYVEYKGKMQPELGESDEIPVQPTEVVEGSIAGVGEVWEDIIYKFNQEQSENGSLAEGNSVELDKYYSEGRERDKGSFLILDWWKQNSQSTRFPILSQIARDVLAIPVSTVASESTFSTGGRVLDPFRSSLSPRMVEFLICAQDWLRSPGSVIEVEENLEDMDKLENDLMNMTLSSEAPSSSTAMDL